MEAVTDFNTILTVHEQVFWFREMEIFNLINNTLDEDMSLINRTTAWAGNKKGRLY